MTKREYTDLQEKTARFAKALGHPARIAILEFLAGRDTCYFGAIHEELPIAKATVSQHLKELKAAGLIQGEVELPKHSSANTERRSHHRPSGLWNTVSPPL